MPSKKRILALALIVAFAFGATSAWAGAEGEQRIKVGGLIPLTGPLSEYGEGFRKAGDLAVLHFEAAGFPLELRFTDTETSAIPGVEAARTLVDIERVVALAGAASSGVTIPIAQSVAIPSQIPIISNASSSSLITFLPADQGQDFVFRTTASDQLQSVVLGKLAADEGYKKAAVFYVNNPYGQGLMNQFKDSFEFRGGEVVVAVPHDEKPAATYVSELKQIADSGADVMLALGYPGQATVYLKEFFEAGYNENIDLLFCDGTKSVEMPKALGAKNLVGFVGTAAGSVGGVSLENFKADYKKYYGELPPLPYMDSYYDAVVIIGLAVAACQAADLQITGVNVRDMIREVANPGGEKVYAGEAGVRKALDLIKQGKSINYEGVAGAVDFDSNGDVTTAIEVWKFVEKEPFIETVRFETDIPER